MNASGISDGMERRPSRGAGFTLIELLVASTIGSLVVVMVAAVLIQVVNGWQVNTSRMQAEVDARVALELISDDLRSIVVRDDGTEWLRVVPEGDVGPSGAFAESTPWVMFCSETSDPHRISEGDTAAVSYRIAYRDPFDGDLPIFALYRKVLGPEETLAALGERDLAGGLWSGYVEESRAIEALVAAQVVGLEIVFWMEGADGVLRAVDSGREIRAGGGFSVDPPVSGLAGARPSHADITLTTLDVHGPEWGSVPQSEHLRRYGRTFTSRVDFSARVR